jgi:hypothetical protein
MTNKISAGKRDKKWKQYGIEQIPIKLNGEDTTHRVLAKHGEFVGIVGKHYRVLPNELALELADESARLTNMQPVTGILDSAMGYKGMNYFNDNQHVIQNKWKMHAFYDTGREVDINGGGLKLGVALHNSIDGSMGFNVGIFTFRYICSNMVFVGFKGASLQGQTLDYLYGRHTQSLRKLIDELQVRIMTIMEKAHLIVDAYEEMARVKATEELIKKIRASRISDKVLPEYMKLEELQLKDLTQWNVYNDITEAIWHSPKANLDTKMTYMDQLHRVMPVIPRRA